MDLTPFIIGGFVFLIASTCVLALVQNVKDIKEEAKHKTE